MTAAPDFQKAVAQDGIFDATNMPLPDVKVELYTTPTLPYTGPNTPELVGVHFKHKTIMNYPKGIRADNLLNYFFPQQISAADDQFLSCLVFICDFYTDLLHLPMRMGAATQRGYYYFLGDVQSKRLRFAIAEDEEVRKNTLSFGESYLQGATNQVAGEENATHALHQMGLHLAILRCQAYEEDEQFQPLSENDPLVRMFAVCQIYREQNTK